MTVNDCTPPAGTKPGTLWLLRKPGCVPIIVRWDETGYIRDFISDDGIAHPRRFAESGWRLAGQVDEAALPQIPRTPQEFAREAVESVGKIGPRDVVDCWAIITTLLRDLRTIADMPESGT